MAPVPKHQDPPSIGEQLAAALKDADVSQSELARRLAPGGDEKKQESKRRWIAKILKDKIARPGMRPIEQALSLPPGYFRLPTVAQVRQRRVRLEELEAEVAWLREWVGRGFAALGVAPELQDEARHAQGNGD